MKLEGRIFAVAFWVLEALLLPSTNPNTLYFVYLFLHKDQGKNFLLLRFGCLKPFLLTSPNRNTLEFVLISPWRLREEFMSLFFEYKRSRPPFCEKQLQTQVSHKKSSGS